MIFGFGVTARRSNDRLNLRSATWIGPWLVGLTVISLAGRYGTGSKNWLPDFVDLRSSRVLAGDLLLGGVAGLDS